VSSDKDEIYKKFNDSKSISAKSKSQERRKALSKASKINTNTNKESPQF